MVITILVGVIIAPIVYVYQDITWKLTPEFYENTAELRQEAPSFFKKHTGLDIPVGAKLVHVAYNRDAVLDYEANHHVILDASGMDLKKWISTAKPFGKNLRMKSPFSTLGWTSYGLKCEERIKKEAESKITPNFPKKPVSEYVMPICRLMVSGREVWQVVKRLRLDRLVTLVVLEDEKLIWLQEINS